jgi:crotonobetainyl-CoA:carnitine CoA-transferase CaiB-like acyl-CoA transferase
LRSDRIASGAWRNNSSMAARMSRADLLQRLEVAGVHAGPINNLAQVFSDPQVLHRGMRLDLPSATGGGAWLILRESASAAVADASEIGACLVAKVNTPPPT